MLINMVLPGAVETARLPAEYQEVEYIQSGGTQYIDSKYKPTSENLKIVYDFTYPSSGAGSLFGSAVPGSPYSIVAFDGLSFYVGTSGALLPQTTTSNTRYFMEAHAKNGTLTVLFNGVKQTASYTGSILKTYSLFLFANSNKGTAYQFCSIKLYACQIYDNEVLVRDFVPCYRKADNVVGLYDMVNGVFYANAGSGTFAKGENIGGTVAPPSTGEPSFTYSGNFTDNRVSGKGTVRFNTSGVLTVTGSPITVVAKIVGGGGGAVCNSAGMCGAGGGGGVQEVEVTLEAGTYDIIIGTGGKSVFTTYVSAVTANAGGDTTAFGKTSTGGGAGKAANVGTGGIGGTPNGKSGGTGSYGTATGGSPNGGSSSNRNVTDGGNGYVELTFI